MRLCKIHCSPPCCGRLPGMEANIGKSSSNGSLYVANILGCECLMSCSVHMITQQTTHEGLQEKTRHGDDLPCAGTHSVHRK